MAGDPYTDPVTGVLRNKLGLRTADELEATEREITHAALILLRESPVRPTWDLAHLCTIHRRIFGDIYEWAGQIRTVAMPRMLDLTSRCGFVLRQRRVDVLTIDAQKSHVRGRGQPVAALVDRKHLLSSVEMAHFVSHGSIILERAVPEELNERAIEVFDAGIPGYPYGTPLDEAFPPGTFVRKLLDLPIVAGALQSLVGPGPRIDHHAVHIRPPHGGEAQNMHGDAILDTRTDAFDVQLMYYPRAVTLEQGGTLTVPGSHMRKINQFGIGRYQNLAGQTRMVCPAGTVALLHHGIWHGGRRNDSGQPRYMFKIRFNPAVRQLRLWNTDDIDDPGVIKELMTSFGWTQANEGRLDLVNRAKLWRALTGDQLFDLDYYLTREQLTPQFVAPGATDIRLGSSNRAVGWQF